MKKMVEIAYRGYELKKESIDKGWISQENIEWVTDKLMLKLLTNAELGMMWKAVSDYFLEQIAELDEEGNVIAWKAYTKEIAFAMDTKSAWLEVVNIEARRRKALGTL